MWVTSKPTGTIPEKPAKGKRESSSAPWAEPRRPLEVGACNLCVPVLPVDRQHVGPVLHYGLVRPSRDYFSQFTETNVQEGQFLSPQAPGFVFALLCLFAY